VDFPFAERAPARTGRFEADLDRGASPAGSSPMSLKKGMSWDEVRRALGEPEKTVDRMEGRLKVTTATFTSGDHRIEADFVEGVLIKYSISSR
jgi:hypothetical protein